MLNTNYVRAEEVNQKIEEVKRGKMELPFFGSRVILQCMEEFVHAWQSVDFQRQIVDWIHEDFSSFQCRHLPFCISNIAISLSQKFNRKSSKTKRGKVKFFALLLQYFTNRGKAEKDKVCRWLSDRALPEVRRLNSVFYNKYHTETSLLPPSVCCKLPAAEGVAINRKYEQIINTVTNRTSGQNDFIFSIFATGQVSAECHQAITSILLVECGRSVQNCLARAFAKLIHLLCFQS